MTLVIASRRVSMNNLCKHFGDAFILDVTSHGPEPWVRFSPFYPLGNVPVPFSPGHVSASVEGIWQGLKVFESQGVDVSKFTITDMKGIKRSSRRYGRVLGHRAGVMGKQLLGYAEARRAIYLPSYHWVLEHCLQAAVNELRRLSRGDVVLLDYETNGDISDTSRPLSHAQLIKMYVEGHWPQ